MVKNLPANAGDERDVGLLPGSGRSPGEGNGNPFQYSCLNNPMDRGAWQATVHRLTKSQTRLKGLSMHICISLLNSFNRALLMINNVLGTVITKINKIMCRYLKSSESNPATDFCK